MIEILYSESGSPKTVIMSWADYCDMKEALDPSTVREETLAEVMDHLESYIRTAQEERAEAENQGEVEFEDDDGEIQRESVPSPITSPENRGPILRYKGAEGYRLRTGEFCVLKGSLARIYTVPTFDAKIGLSRERKKLLELGIMKKHPAKHGYEFTEDYLFANSSRAACVISGNSRSGPDVWK